ncbi:hypothetical protein PIROE2DRAFT_1220 [Piromyces sp. E2]|nr:hypothetical protein PIROE2DRAFT_1220 [Piromyces sp. E2]|eukprot:OUM70678.1 hypothetical protein PIROE2DRAFT_1220 [Piromyces sp. E2]
MTIIIKNKIIKVNGTVEDKNCEIFLDSCASLNAITRLKIFKWLCTTIYKFEIMGEFKINASFEIFFDEDIINLRITKNENNFHLKYGEDDPNSNCIFINLDTKEIIRNFRKYTIETNFKSGNKYYLNQRIKCKNTGFVLTNEIFKYRSIDEDNNKNEIIVLLCHINTDSLSDTITIIPYENLFESKDVGITCTDDVFMLRKTNSLSIELDKICNSNEFIWEILESGNDVLRNVNTGKYLIIMNSNKNISISSYSSNPNIALIRMKISVFTKYEK